MVSQALFRASIADIPFCCALDTLNLLRPAQDQVHATKACSPLGDNTSDATAISWTVESDSIQLGSLLAHRDSSCTASG
jgi:hypothetical protein